MCTNHNLFEEKGEPKRIRTEVLPLPNLTPYRWAKPAHDDDDDDDEDYFYIALFSALDQTPCALIHEGLTFYSAFLNIHRSGVLTALAWLVPRETAAVSAQVLCTPYNHAPCHFMQSHIRQVYMLKSRQTCTKPQFVLGVVVCEPGWPVRR